METLILIALLGILVTILVLQAVLLLQVRMFMRGKFLLGVEGCAEVLNILVEEISERIARLMVEIDHLKVRLDSGEPVRASALIPSRAEGSEEDRSFKKGERKGNAASAEAERE